MSFNQFIEEIKGLCQNEELLKKLSKVELDMKVGRITEDASESVITAAVEDYEKITSGKPYWIATIKSCIKKFYHP